MARILDITEQLNFEENPQIKVKDVLIEVNTDATTALKLMQILSQSQGEFNFDSMTAMYNQLFNEEDRAKIDNLNLQFKDWSTLIKNAMSFIIDSEDLGE